MKQTNREIERLNTEYYTTAAVYVVKTLHSTRNSIKSLTKLIHVLTFKFVIIFGKQLTQIVCRVIIFMMNKAMEIGNQLIIVIVVSNLVSISEIPAYVYMALTWSSFF